MKRKASTTLVHEYLQGKHRIVQISSDGTNDAGGWAHDTDLASFKSLLASTGYIQELPVGIFSVTSKAQQVLS